MTASVGRRRACDKFKPCIKTGPHDYFNYTKLCSDQDFVGKFSKESPCGRYHGQSSNSSKETHNQLSSLVGEMVCPVMSFRELSRPRETETSFIQGVRSPAPVPCLPLYVVMSKPKDVER